MPPLAKVGWVYDPLYLGHDTGTHPESARRLLAIQRLLSEAGLLDRLAPLTAVDATVADLELVHRLELVQRIQALCAEGGGHLDTDTVVSPRSYDAALRAVGGCLRATDAVLAGEVDSAFCAVRPPGHHATPLRAMGFCLFNNVAIAARHALARRGLQRVAIVDFDVHHGNGSQDAFYDDPSVLYLSAHQYPLFPGTGRWDETGSGEGSGHTINVPLPPGCGDEEYGAFFTQIAAPALRRYRPQLILVSAGYDAHFADPLASMMLSVAGYYRLAMALRELAAELCGGRLVFTLEGGYHLDALAWSVRACLDALAGNPFVPDPVGPAPAETEALDITPLLAYIGRLHGLE